MIRFAIFALGALFCAAHAEAIACNAIFEERKSELIEAANRIEEQRKLNNIFFDEQKRSADVKIEALKVQEQRVNSLIAEAKSREENIRNLIAQNEDLLAQIEQKKGAKIAETYAKMKDSKAASILENLALHEAAEILFAMDSKDVGKIFSKMDAQKAARLTELLKKGPPFEDVE